MSDFATNLGDVAGTDEYYERSQKDFSHGIFQLGGIFLATELNIPYFMEPVFATQLAINGEKVLDIEQTEGETALKYILHTDHDRSEKCRPNCNKVQLTDFLHQIPNVEENIELGTIANYTRDTFFRKEQPKSFQHFFVINLDPIYSRTMVENAHVYFYV